MRFAEYTIGYNRDIIELLSRCFNMTAEESGIMLGDALKNGGCLLCADDGKAVSVSLFKDVSLRFGGVYRKGVYIFGLCTAEEYRGRGSASGLIDEICGKSGGDFAVLIPENDALTGFYEQLGFALNGYGASLNVQAAEKQSVRVVDSLSDAYRAYGSAVEMYEDICVLSESDLAASLSLSGQACVAGDNGVCFIGDYVEAFAPADDVSDLSASALELLGIPQATVVTPLSSAPVGAEPLPLGMIKPLRGELPPERFYINNLFNL